jgi:putative sugar O-methyltransferase
VGIEPTTSRPSSAGELQRLLEERRATPQWLAYQEARERVLAIKDAEARRLSGVHRPSEYWTEELAGFEYMLDASPLMIDKLRHQTYHVTGLRVYDYRTNKDEQHRQLEEKLRVLIELGGRELLVPESRQLGGFGFEIDGELYNIDTLKFYEVLIAMQRGGVLSAFRGTSGRQAVVEIGAGWGGFAYQFKTVCPDTTYYIVDFPELFLFSATYLKTLFPTASFLFLGEDGRTTEEVLEAAPEADFVFVPHTAIDDLHPQRLDMAINMVSFQEMTSEQVRNYVHWSANLGCPYLYSLNRDRSAYNRELTSVHEIIAERYWAREIPVLPVSYTQMLPPRMRSPLIRTKIKQAATMPYKHVIGFRKEGG